MMRSFSWLLILLVITTRTSASFPDNICDQSNTMLQSWKSPCVAYNNNSVLRPTPFCNTSLDDEARLDWLLLQSSIFSEKDLISNLLVNRANSSIFPPYEWWNEALHGIGCSPGVSYQAPTTVSTSFPVPLALACTFSTSVFHSVASAISTEARNFFNAGHSGLTFWAPNVNLYRDPRWGRGMETPGEDPALTSAYAVSFVTGLQGSSEDKSRLKTSACCKHFRDYSQETNRYFHNAIVSAQDEEESYLPAFKACVTKANVSCIMCSYNAINGIPSCADTNGLSSTLSKWGFNGYIVSDCSAIEYIMTQHHYTNTTFDTVLASLSAGVDLNCGSFYRRKDDMEKVPLSLLKARLRNLLRVQLRLGMFDTKLHYSNNNNLASDNSKKLNLLAATESIVLLKNINNTLPLSNTTSTLVMGPNANVTQALLGNYYGITKNIVSPLSELQMHFENVHYVPGMNNVSSVSKTGFQEAVNAVQNNSYKNVILIMGLDPKTIENEMLDRKNTALPGVQDDFIKLICKHVLHTKITLVIISGGSVDLQDYYDYNSTGSCIGAILYAPYGGELGGKALVNILVGKSNPSGRLSHTFYKKSYFQNVTLSNMAMRRSAAKNYPGRSYKFVKPSFILYPFGYGLSYTTFSTSWLSYPRWYNLFTIERSAEHMIATIKVAVQNSGQNRAGKTAVLIFAHHNEGKRLVAFDKTKELRPNESQVLTLQFDWKEVFKTVRSDGSTVTYPGRWLFSINEKSFTKDINVGYYYESQLSTE